MDPMIRKQLESINSALSRSMALYGRWAKKHGLNYNSLMVLYAMEGAESCTQKDICEAWMLPKTTVGTILSDFREKGYLVLSPDSSDKRERVIRLTETGEAFSRSLLAELHEAEERALQKMGPGLCRQLVDSNIAFTEAFGQEVRHG